MLFNVVEVPQLIKKIPYELKLFPRLNFYDNLKDFSKPIDVIHIGSTIQYIDDWKSLLKEMTKKFFPKFFVLSDLLVGSIPSFVSVQSYYDRKICVRFINEEEFCNYWKTLDYDLIFKSFYQPIEGDGYFPTDGLPKTHRLNKPCNMIFSRKNI